MSPLSFLEAAHLITGRNKKKLLKQIIQGQDLQETFVSFVIRDIFNLPKFQTLAQCQLVVVQKTTLHHNRLLFDGRFLKGKLETTPIQCFLLDETECLLNHTSNIKSMPKLDDNNYQNLPPQESLWKLLNLTQAEPDPTNLEETVLFLTKHGLQDKATIDIYSRVSPHPFTVFWHYPLKDEKFRLQAYTLCNYTLGFQLYKGSKPIKPKKCVLENIYNREHPPQVVPPNPYESNRSAAVQVKLSGLNQALRLGVITKEEFKHLSKRLSLLAGSLWIDYDCQEHARHLTFVDYETKQCWELSCQDTREEEKVWNDMFEFVYCVSREKVTREKKTLLSDVINRLSIFVQDSTGSPFKNCLESLNRCIKKYTLLVYSEGDQALHATKDYFCNFMNLKKNKNFRGISLKSGTKNEVVALVTPEMQIVNIGSYFDGCDILPQDVDILTIDHNCKDLKNQTKFDSNTSLASKIKSRGVYLAGALINIWHTLGNEFVAKFMYDIFSTEYVSLSALAFKSVWLKYDFCGGKLHHSLEKIKPFYEDLLRKDSHGGFAYSCQDRLCAGDPLFPNNPASPAAETIVEYDISSSYGYAASHMTVPTGFCVGYLNNGNGQLKRSDYSLRHKSFEFQSVFYTLSQMTNVLYVYSNFHALGILQIGPYPIDLAVFVQGASLELFQFDGEYAHGCELCNNLDAFVGNKCRETVIEDTKKRDAFITEWAQKVNNKNQSVLVNYTVITDCHHPGYLKKDLQHTFKTDPLLVPLVSCYPTERNINYNKVIHCDPNLTFIAFVRGKAARPAFFMKKEEDARARRYSETGNQDLMVTKDFLDYLVDKQAFQVDQISAVLFYRRCQVFSKIYQQLIDWRSVAVGPTQTQFIKNIVNYSCGFFGYNQHKAATPRCRLSTKLPRTFDISRTQVDMSGTIGKKEFIVTKMYKKVPGQQYKRKKSVSPLALFVCVIEYGKLRVSQILNFVESNTKPECVRHMYTNVDNFIFALSTPTLFDAKTIDDTEWHAKSAEFFQAKKPGHLKTEWIVTQHQDWKYVSPMVQNWALLTNDPETERHKNSALSHVSSQSSYTIACNLLERKLSQIVQMRRVNKMASTKMCEQVFVFHPSIDKK